MSECFWIVWNPMSPYPPTIRYPRRKDAQGAARAMAKKYAHEGAYFYVMKAQSCHQMQGGIANFMIAPWGVGAPCPLHGPVIINETNP